MRDYILLAIILGSVPICLIRPYFGVLMWYWVTYFNPHKFTWGIAYDFPVAMVIAIPTLIGTVFARKSLRSLGTRESVMLLMLWAWFAIVYIHAQGVPLFTGNMADAAIEMSHMSKIFLFTIVLILLVTSKQKVRWVLMVTACSLGLLAVKGALFGIRTGGARVWGPPDSFLSDNNAFGLALNMAIPLLFFLARSEKNKWVKLSLHIMFLSAIVGVVLTYSRGGLLGLIMVTAAIIAKTRHKFVGAALVVVAVFLVIGYAPDAWMSRMGQFANGDLDGSAEQRLVSWGTAWNLSHDYPLGGSFDALPNVDVFQRYETKPLPGGFLSSGPHSIYFQLLADQGFPGALLFLAIIASSFWSLWSVMRQARARASTSYLEDYAYMTGASMLGFMVSGAFLGFAYLDVIYEMIGLAIVLKMLLRTELETEAVDGYEHSEATAIAPEHVAVAG